MKYFSPSILDGSVTTAKIALAAVTLEKIATSTASQAGSIAAVGTVTLTLNNRSFFPDIEAEDPVTASLNIELLARDEDNPAATATAPEIDIHNEATGNVSDYSAAWNFISP